MTNTCGHRTCFDASCNAAMARDAELETTIPVPSNVPLVIKAVTEQELSAPADVGRERVMFIALPHPIGELELQKLGERFKRRARLNR